MKSCSFRSAVLLVVSLLLSQLAAQDQSGRRNYGVDFNNQYHSPFSFGIEYQSVSPLTRKYDEEYRFTDLALHSSYSFKNHPVLQPFACLGLQLVGPVKLVNDENDERFSHNLYYGTVGFAYATKLNKQLEMGGDLYAGIGQAVYSGIQQVDGDSRGAWELLAGAGVHAAFNMSFNLSLSIHPTLRYRQSFSPLDRYNGFSFGLGFSASYRVGQDPDAPQAELRSIKFGEFNLPPLFASMQSYYTKNPIAVVEIVNIEKHPIQDVNIRFQQAGFMDAPTTADSIAEIGPGESVSVDIYAAFNQEVFSTEGITPLVGELLVDYLSRGNAGNQVLTVSYDLYDKESLTWDDDRKMAAYITPSDSALRNYASFVRQSSKDVENPGLNSSLQTGLQIYYGLTEIGCIYQKDPTSPFDAAQENPLVIDAVSLPRSTLKRGTGDCDDLTALYCSLLESVGIETAFITTPGHIYAAFNTGEQARNYQMIHPDKSRTLTIDGEIWIPVEITMIGTTGFADAWKVGADEFNKYEDSPEKRGLFRTREAQEIYRPVGLKETDLGLQYGDKAVIGRIVSAETNSLVGDIIDSYDKESRRKDSKSSYNQLGTICARFGLYNRAEQAFNYALALDRNYLPSKMNLANVFFLKGQYQNALRLYHNVEQDYLSRNRTSSASYERVLLNLARTYYELENFDKSSVYARQLKESNPDMLRDYSYLDDNGRSALTEENS
ncbi:MAG: hypothetical protein B6241_01710 [Spirochaetaceae bacterium 4572_59]|nr:MAG: hypothetical protein B6241_01710 [Spirochaetaceae bacterium 4572_59]